MGLFNKEPAESKAYWKAFSTALKKPGTDTFAALEKASGAWPSGWEGYFLMGLSYDLAAGVEFNPDKAADYHYKAKDAANKAGAGWVSEFYNDYDHSQPNFRASDDYFPRAMNVRRMGVAVLRNLDHERSFIQKNDRKFWKDFTGNIDTGGIFRSTDEQFQVSEQLEPFTDYLGALDDFYGVTKMSQEGLVSRSNALIKKSKKLAKTDPAKITASFVDTWFFVEGLSLIQGGPYTFSNGDQNRPLAWNKLWTGAHRGSAPCLHTLGYFLVADDGAFTNDVIREGMSIYKCSWEDLRRQVITLLEMSAKKGDTEADVILAAFIEKFPG